MRKRKHLFRSALARRKVYVDAVGDLKARFLAHGLDFGDQFALGALVEELLCETGVECDSDAAARRRLIALGGLGEDLQILLQQHDGRIERDGIAAAVPDGGDDLCPIALRKELRDRLELLAVLGPERAQLRL